MSQFEIEKQISKVENELSKDFSQYTERKLHNMLISLRIKLNEINVVSAWKLKNLCYTLKTKGNKKMKTYSIIRYSFENGNKKIHTGLSLKDAQEHCQRNDTQAEQDETGHRAWFDGYVSE